MTGPAAPVSLRLPAGPAAPALDSPPRSSLAKTNESLPEVNIERCFDAFRIRRIVEEVVQKYNVPVVFLALNSPTGVLKLKARHGTAVESVGQGSVARHWVDRDLPIIIEDIEKDGRFVADPLVVGPPPLKFFTGAPLMLRPGRCVGSLCIMDDRPRVPFSLDDAAHIVEAAKTICDIYKSAVETKDFWTLTVSDLSHCQGSPSADSSFDGVKGLASLEALEVDSRKDLGPYPRTGSLESLPEGTEASDALSPTSVGMTYSVS